MNRQFRKHLPVQPDVRLQKPSYQLGIGNPLFLGGNSDSRRPEFAEVAFSKFPVTRGGPHPPSDRLRRRANQRRFRSAISAGPLENLASPSAGLKPTLRAWHVVLLFLVGVRYLSPPEPPICEPVIPSFAPFAQTE